jgi:cytochrome c oxidase assembly protein subunit 16
MPAFGSKTFRRATTASSTLGERLGTIYRATLPRHPFLLFGLPFITVIVAASFVLTPATALRYERHDRRVRQLDQEEAIALGLKREDGKESITRNPRRHIVGSDREEYYVCELRLLQLGPCDRDGDVLFLNDWYGMLTRLQRLMAKDLDNWEQTRVKRFKGEPDGRFD